METSVRFTLDKVVFDQSHDIHAVISLKAPKLERTEKRPPVCIIPIVDVSGSMGDRVNQQGSKLDFAKKSLIKLVEHLRPDDYFGAVKFSTWIEDICTPGSVTDSFKVKIQSEIMKLVPTSSTNLSDAMMRGLEMANSLDLPKEVLVRVILFTDGLPNAGVATTRDGISRLLKANLGKATLSAFGYGIDADQELLASLASLGKGNFAFIDNPDKASTAFAKELGGLLSTHAQDIKIEVEPQGGHEITKVVSDVTSSSEDKKVKIEVADLLSEETRQIVLAVKLAEQTQALPRPLNVLALKVTYSLIDDDGKKQRKEEEVKGKIEFVKDGNQQKKPTQEVVDVVSVHQVLEAQLEADKMVQSGDYQGAHQFMMGVQGAVGACGSVGAAGMASWLAKGLVDSHTYASYSGTRSSVGSSVRGRSVVSDNETESVLSCCNLSVTNSAQADMVASFQGSDDDSFVVDVSNVPPSSVAAAMVSPKEEKKLKSGKKSKSRSQRW